MNEKREIKSNALVLEVNVNTSYTAGGKLLFVHQLLI